MAKANNYLDNSKIHEELKEYVIAYREAKENATTLPRLSNSIGKAIIDTVNGLSFNHKYRGYPFREDMALEAILVVTKYIHNYDFDEYKNPHAYISMVAERLFWRYLEKEIEHFATKQRILSNVDLSAYDTQEFDKDEEFKHVWKEIVVANTTVIETKRERKNKLKEKERKKRASTNTFATFGSVQEEVNDENSNIG